MAATPDLQSSVSELLGNVTEQLDNGGEKRPGQRKMAELVANAMRDQIPTFGGGGNGHRKIARIPYAASCKPIPGTKQ